MRRPQPLLFQSWILALVLAGGGLAQEGLNLSLPSNFPAHLDSEVFANRDALVVKGDGTLQVFQGVPFASIHQEIGLVGSAAPTGPWTRLSVDRAVYLSVGNDLVPGTPDDALVLVTGLPGAPQVIETGILQDSGEFQVLNDSIAFRVVPSSSTIQVLRHTEFGATLSVIASPWPISDASGFSWGATPDGTIIGMSPGADDVFGSTDDRLLRLSGVVSGNPSWSGEALSLLAEGFTVSQSGVGVAWTVTLAPDVLLQLFGAAPAAVPALFLASPPMSGLPSSPSPCRVEPGVGDSVIVSCLDDLGPTDNHQIVHHLSSVPAVAGNYSDDWNGGQASLAIGESEVLRWSAMGPYGFSYEDLQVAGTQVNFSFPWTNSLHFQRPNPNSLVAFGESGASAVALVIRDLAGASAPTQLSTPGTWVGRGGCPLVATLSPGRVVGFVSTDGMLTPKAEVLRIVSTPALIPSGAGVNEGGIPLVDLNVGPALFGPGDTIDFYLDIPTATPESAWLLMSLGSAEAALHSPAFGTGSILRIDTTSLLIAPIPLSGTQGSLHVGVSELQPAAFGVDFHAQGLMRDAFGIYHLSQAWTIIGR